MAAGGMALALTTLGAVFIARPRDAARLFGIPAGRDSRPYVRALGFRDIALALMLATGARNGSPGLRSVAGAAALIPACDYLLVTRLNPRARAQRALHVISGVSLLAIACMAPFRR